MTELETLTREALIIRYSKAWGEEAAVRYVDGPGVVAMGGPEVGQVRGGHVSAWTNSSRWILMALRPRLDVAGQEVVDAILAEADEAGVGL